MLCLRPTLGEETMGSHDSPETSLCKEYHTLRKINSSALRYWLMHSSSARSKQVISEAYLIATFRAASQSCESTLVH